MLIHSSFLIGISILLLRLIIAIILFSSGRSHASHPVERSESLGLSPAVARFLGIFEVLAALSVALGVYTQIGAALIIIVMLGAIFTKIFVWNTGFYAKKGFGWHYDLLILIGALVIFSTAGGSLVLY